MINGEIQTNMDLATIVRPSATTVSVGTQYRGLNCEWFETIVWDRVLSVAELDQVHAYAQSRYGIACTRFSQLTNSPTIWVGGQSNAAGRGDRGASDANIPSEYRGAIANANVWHGQTASNNNTLGVAWQTLNNQLAMTGYTGNHMFGDNAVQPTQFFGFESALCKEWLDVNGGQVYFFKYTTGGSNLEYSASVAHWDATDNTQVQANTLRIFANMARNWWLSMRQNQLANRQPNLLGAIWYQGEQDASNATHAAAYQANLADFATNFRAEIGYSPKILICRLHDECPETHTATVRAAQTAYVAENTATSQLIDTDSYAVRGSDLVHLGGAGQIALGQYLATQL
jgi:hypothetical protein